MFDIISYFLCILPAAISFKYFTSFSLDNTKFNLQLDSVEYIPSKKFSRGGYRLKLYNYNTSLPSFGYTVDSQLSLEIRNLIDLRSNPKAENLLHILQQYGFDNDQIAEIIKKCPFLLKNIDIDRIRSRLNFLSSAICRKYCPYSVIIRSVAEAPQRFFGVDFNEEIVAKYAFFVSNGVDLASEESWVFLKYLDFNNQHLRELGGFSREDFEAFRRKFLLGGLNAVRSGDSGMLRLLLSHGWDPSSETDRSNRTVLMWACSLGQNSQASDILEQLIEFYSQRNCLEDTLGSHSSHGETAMHWVATGGSLPIFQRLHSLGCRPDVENHDKTLPVHWAAGSGALGIVKWYAEDLKLPLDRKNVFGCSVLHFAASGGSLEVCRYLCEERDFDALANNDHGHDALTKAVSFKQNEVVKWLLESIPAVRETLSQRRPWTMDTANHRKNSESAESNSTTESSLLLTLEEIAGIVGNEEGIALLRLYS